VVNSAEDNEQLKQQLVQHITEAKVPEAGVADPWPLPAPLRISSMRLVACHALGVSFWLPVPCIECSCCQERWELKAPAAGFFGNTPVQPGVWISTQLLDTYTRLFASGTSATAFAAAISSVAHTPSHTPGLPQLTTSLVLKSRCVI
jgi:hypothetical protein